MPCGYYLERREVTKCQIKGTPLGHCLLSTMHHSPAQGSRPPSAPRRWPSSSAIWGRKTTHALPRGMWCKEHGSPPGPTCLGLMPVLPGPCKCAGSPIAGGRCWAGAALELLGSWEPRHNAQPQQPTATLAPLALAPLLPAEPGCELRAQVSSQGRAQGRQRGAAEAGASAAARSPYEGDARSPLAHGAERGGEPQKGHVLDGRGDADSGRARSPTALLSLAGGSAASADWPRWC